MPPPSPVRTRPGLVCRGLTRVPWFRCSELVLGPGEVAVLRGPTGAGKTLFLRALADLDPVDAGEVSLGGRSRSETPPAEWRRRVLYVHPGGVRTPGTVRENLRRVAALAVHGGRVLDPGELPADRDAARLSTGEGQLLALARAIGIEPDVLLLDEPTTGLDPDRAQAVEERVAAFARAGGSVLWVSHDASLAERLGARVLRWEEVVERP